MAGLEHFSHFTPKRMTPFASVAGPSCLRQARHKTQRRRPLVAAHRHVGSVAEQHLLALTAWPQWVQVLPDRVVLTPRGDDLTRAMTVMNASLRDLGLIVAWRDEPFALWDPACDEVLARMERASARFWGTLTLGAHCNGYVEGEPGRPARMWVARRSLSKATDPGKQDNLIGGGVPWGQSPQETVIREGWEEAGLQPLQMAGLRKASVLELDRDVPEGRQWERLHVFDLALEAGVIPRNQDGEVAEVRLLPMEEAIGLALADEMTVDAAWVTLDFAIRHGFHVQGMGAQRLDVASHMN